MAQPKVIATLGVALVLAIVAFFVGSPILAAVVVLVGIVGAFLLLRSAGGTLRRSDDADFTSLDDRADGWNDAPAAPAARNDPGGLATWNPSSTPADAEPLSTWSPGPGAGEPLTAWDPGSEPADSEPAPPLQPRASLFDAPAPERPPEVAPDEGRHLRAVENGDTGLRPFEADPLAPWDQGGSTVPEVDEQAEIDRAARVLAGDTVETPINEEVSTADDIMAASEATELHVGGPAAGDDGELAKLLAKVQARLAAYE